MSKKTSKTSTAQDSTFAQRMNALRAHKLAASSDDMNKVLGGGRKASVFAFTEQVNAAIDAHGIDTSAIFATDRNPKCIKRFIQFVHGINARDFKAIDKTSAKILYAMKLAGEHDLTTDALAYLVSGAVRKEGASPEARGVSTRVVSRLFGSVGVTTAPTQISRSVGDNGFMQLAGMTFGQPGKQNRAFTLNAEHPLVREFFAVVEGATDAQLETLAGDEGAGA